MAALPLDDLAVRAGQGDDQAWETLWHALYGQMLGLLLKKGWGYYDAEEIVSTALWKAYRGLPARKPTGSFYNWVFTIVLNAARDHWQAQHEQKRDVNRSVSLEQHNGDHPLHARIPGPEEVYLWKEELQEVRAQLTKKSLWVFDVVAEVGYDPQEIQRLHPDLPYKTITSRMRYLRAQVARLNI